MLDHFKALGLPRRFAVDDADVERRYRDLSRELHPDRFATAPLAERRTALERQAKVNDAYRVLRDPLRRAGHFLELCGLSPEAHDGQGRDAVQLSNEFLTAFLDLREAFAEHASDPKVRAETRERMATERARRIESLSRDLAQVPEVGAGETPARELLLPLAQRLLELRYYDRFLQELEDDEP